MHSTTNSVSTSNVNNQSCTSDDAFASARDESSELVAAIELIEDTTEPDKFKKTLRIKSFKAFEWLEEDRTTYYLLTSVLATQMLERVMWTFFHWQKTDSWLKLESAPLIQMANMKTSPAVAALADIGKLMATRSVEVPAAGMVNLDDLLAGVLHKHNTSIALLP